MLSPLRPQKCHFWPIFTFSSLFSLGGGSKNFFSTPKFFFSKNLIRCGSKTPNLDATIYFCKLCIFFLAKHKKSFLAIFQYKLGPGKNIGVQKPWQTEGFAIKVIKILQNPKSTSNRHYRPQKS